MHRFFVDPDAWSADGCVLAGEEAHHLANVLRLRPGAKILLFDGRGGQWEGEVKSIGGGKVDVAVTGRRDYVPMPLSVNPWTARGPSWTSSSFGAAEFWLPR